MKRFLLLLTFLFLCTMHTDVYAAVSLIPTENTGAGLPGNCIDLAKELAKRPHAGDWLALKIQCGRMTLDDAMYYLKYMISFVFDILGTIGVLAVIRAGYHYIWDQNKEKGYKQIQAAVLGLVVAFGSFTIARVVFSFFQVF